MTRDEEVQELRERCDKLRNQRDDLEDKLHEAHEDVRIWRRRAGIWQREAEIARAAVRSSLPAGDESEDTRLRDGLAAAWSVLSSGDAAEAQRVLETVLAGGDAPVPAGDEGREALLSAAELIVQLAPPEHAGRKRVIAQVDAVVASLPVPAKGQPLASSPLPGAGDERAVVVQNTPPASGYRVEVCGVVVVPETNSMSATEAAMAINAANGLPREEGAGDAP